MEAMTRLRQAFELLRSRRIDIHDYDGELERVVGDIFTAETFIAGIAYSLLEGVAVDQEYRSLVVKPFMDRSHWCFQNGETFDLTGEEPLLKYAQAVELLRRECEESLA